MATPPSSSVVNSTYPLRSLQGGAALGFEPQRSPPSATSGPSQTPCCAWGRWRTATPADTKEEEIRPAHGGTQNSNECLNSMTWNRCGCALRSHSWMPSRFLVIGLALCLSLMKGHLSPQSHEQTSVGCHRDHTRHPVAAAVCAEARL